MDEAKLEKWVGGRSKYPKLYIARNNYDQIASVWIRLCMNVACLYINNTNFTER